LELENGQMNTNICLFLGIEIRNKFAYIRGVKSKLSYQNSKS